MGSNLARAARHKEIYRVCQLIAVSFSFTSIPCTRLAIVCFVAENMRVTMQYFFFLLSMCTYCYASLLQMDGSCDL